MPNIKRIADALRNTTTPGAPWLLAGLRWARRCRLQVAGFCGHRFAGYGRPAIGLGLGLGYGASSYNDICTATDGFAATRRDAASA